MTRVQKKAPARKPNPIAKPGQKASGLNQSNPSNMNREAIYIQAMNTSYEILDSDLQKVQQSQPLAARSLEEAYAVVVLLRFASSAQAERTVRTQDLQQDSHSAPPNQQEQQPRSFQELFRPYGVSLDLMRALRTNPFVQSTRIYQLASEAAKRLSPSSPDRLSLIQLLQGKLQRFQSLLSEQGQSVPASNGQAMTGSSRSPAEPTPTRPVNSDISIAELRQGDSILRRASLMAARGEYKEAIDLAARIEGEDPLFGSAQEKIKEFSNMAVQSLRQKAAQAFQSALPVSDKETKAAYLLEAQGYLEEAISNYPNADQLNTVRENLKVISQDLEVLNEEPKERG